jgi:hypothetical protein
MKKKSPKLLTEIRELIKPVTTKETKEKEEKETKVIAEKKALKRDLKEEKFRADHAQQFEKRRTAQRKEALQDLIKSGTVEAVPKGFALKGYADVPMPELLVDRFIDFIALGRSTQPLVNFWIWCLLNPNKKARYKLFAYLHRHRLIITPSGYFVTYRMVKSTPTSKEDGIYVANHRQADGSEFKHIVGQVSWMDRKDCDEEGANDCSAGLHTGSPDFIGIKLGEGYDKGEIKTKAQGGGYGTGYDAPKEVIQKFDNTFGNQAIICLVNPMHVVSIPDSDTRKMRSSEFYFAKLTTAEEVIGHLTEYDYSIFDSDYAAIEAGRLKEMLKDAKLEDYTDGTVEQLKNETKSAYKSRVDAIEARLEALQNSLLNEKVADDVSPNEMMRIIQSRVKAVKNPVKPPMDSKKVKGIADVIEATTASKVKVEPKKEEVKEKVAPKAKVEAKTEPKVEPKKVPTKVPVKEEVKVEPKKATKPTPIKEVAKVEPKKNEKDIKAKPAPEPVKPKQEAKKEVVKAPPTPAPKVKKAKEDPGIAVFVKEKYASIKKAKKSPKKFFVVEEKGVLSLISEVAHQTSKAKSHGSLEELFAKYADK